MTRLIPVDIDGLNLILGGGVPVLKRREDSDESATLLVRGAPGAGKTILGTQIAGSLARSLGCDVAYACVEILPAELAAQRGGLGRERVKERVIVPPFVRTEPDSNECRIYAAVLDLGPPGHEAARLEQAVLDLLDTINSGAGRPRVLVIDSLSDGYNLGAKASRVLADTVCKLAASLGLLLVLLEETTGARPSAWSFAADLIFELGSTSKGVDVDGTESIDRTIDVIKNRFGPSSRGAHRLDFSSEDGMYMLPHPRLYLLRKEHLLLPTQWGDTLREKQVWTGIGSPSGWPSFRTCVTAVFGPESHLNFKTAARLGTTTAENEEVLVGTDVFLDFSRAGAPDRPGELHTASLGLRFDSDDPYLTGDRILATTLAALEVFHTSREPVRRILIGDLRSIRTHRNPSDLQRALRVLFALARSGKIPVITFETSPPTLTPSDRGHPVVFTSTGATPPFSADFADVTIEILPKSRESEQSLFATYVRSGEQVHQELIV